MRCCNKPESSLVFEVEDSRTFCLDELRISSTAIREALAKDDLQHAENLLGKPYRILEELYTAIN